jgi:hypothetical protein
MAQNFSDVQSAEARPRPVDAAGVGVGRHAGVPPGLGGVWRASVFCATFALPSTVIGVGLVALWNRPGMNFIKARR